MSSKNGPEGGGYGGDEVTRSFNPPVNILLVDDQANNLLALEAILEPLGQRLIKARSGTEALGRLLDNDFALILMEHIESECTESALRNKYVHGR